MSAMDGGMGLGGRPGVAPFLLICACRCLDSIARVLYSDLRNSVVVLRDRCGSGWGLGPSSWSPMAALLDVSHQSIERKYAPEICIGHTAAFRDI